MMADAASLPRPPVRWLRWFLSVPIYGKIVGIGALVAVLFAAISLYNVRGSLANTLHELLEQRTRTVADSLASHLERPVVTGDLFTVEQCLREAIERRPDARYIIVTAKDGRVLAHTFAGGVPPDLLAAVPPGAGSGGWFQVLGSAEGRLFDAAAPILGGRAGRVRVGLTDRLVAVESASVTRSFLGAMLVCVAIGEGLALVLAYILTRPIHHLVLAAHRIRRGDFGARAKVFWEDEIGKLAAAFNQMAEGLEQYRREVDAKETARRALIGRIVLAQEEERKSLARDLHDQLGQSLLALLLAIGSAYEERSCPPELYRELEADIRRLIDEVRRLAWGMRPSILDDYGLESALARYVQEASSHFDVEIDYQSIGPSDLPRLPDLSEITLYRIAQEAIHNVCRHARARRASVVLFRRREEAVLLVEDDGVGFDVAAAGRNSAGCMGLLGMKERAALLGGTFDVESAPGRGTTLRVRIPVDGRDACRSGS